MAPAEVRPDAVSHGERMSNAPPKPMTKPPALLYQHATRDRDQAIAKALGGLVRDARSARPSAGKEAAE